MRAGGGLPGQAKRVALESSCHARLSDARSGAPFLPRGMTAPTRFEMLYLTRTGVVRSIGRFALIFMQRRQKLSKRKSRFGLNRAEGGGAVANPELFRSSVAAGIRRKCAPDFFEQLGRADRLVDQSADTQLARTILRERGRKARGQNDRDVRPGPQ